MPALREVSWGWGWLPALTGQADASGALELLSDAVELEHQWRVDRILVQAASDSSHLGTCLVYRGDQTASRYVDGTACAALDEWESPSPYYLGAGEQLLFVFSGLLAGAQATVLVHRENQLLVATPVDPTYRTWT